jgi:hexosaminidase
MLSKNSNAFVKLVENGKELDDLKQAFYINKATGKKLTLVKQPMGGYQGQGEFSLVNGVYSNKNLSFPDLLGWAGSDMEATIDLGKMESVSTVRLHTLDQTPSWIYLPKEVEVYLSADGKNFTSAGISNQFVTDTLRTGFYTVSFEKKTARYVKVIARNYGIIPAGNPGAGSRALLFADEIQVNE